MPTQNNQPVIHICQQEIRIAKLEADMTGHNRDIQNLIKRLDNLTKGLWALVLTLIPLIFLTWQVLHK
jgi:hypothetical protein